MLILDNVSTITLFPVLLLKRILPTLFLLLMCLFKIPNTSSTGARLSGYTGSIHNLSPWLLANILVWFHTWIGALLSVILTLAISCCKHLSIKPERIARNIQNWKAFVVFEIVTASQFPSVQSPKIIAVLPSHLVLMIGYPLPFGSQEYDVFTDLLKLDSSQLITK